ncbi:beta-galactosidase [Rhizobium lusitanum]|uniref:Beta-galactosidase n=1 Tax=Rhizobium lusitanum TaxID=293958 RepID=A0A1C3XEX6_9HYPH|nr:beta-galactosidase [Rhizobium lusitanum]SCB50830.1 beta-galactosidase [Rhizobium lusitanum]
MLGVCYYPEHWNEEWWPEDARQMREIGIRYVRIGEFAWSRMEPEQGRYDWDWLDRAIEILAAEGLKIVLGTPTAAAPKWLVDLYPDVLPVGEDGKARLFGSRRHYTPASEQWLSETRRIVEVVAARYGRHPAVVGWQIDNEFGGDDTVLSYGPEDAAGFRNWLSQRYQSPQRLNEDWGNVFWSMEVNSFDEVIPPVGAVSETNPAARLDFWRYASDSLAEYCALQAAIIRKHSPDRFITHNFMGFFHNFDHFKLAESLDFCSWDSYPLGKVEHFPLPEAERVRWYNTSHPDFSAFHHDLYRGIRNDRFWIMEQQPGPVNWAHWNPAPANGMVRLWTWEAFAHGAEVVSYFRWRQLPYAQEQMHAGLQRPDRQPSPGGLEVAQVAREIEVMGDLPPVERAEVAIVLDYEASWITRIQPQGDDFNYKLLLHAWYEAARRLGVDVDVVAPGQSLAGYKLVLVPCLPIIDDRSLAAFKATTAHIIFGPRTGSKTTSHAVPWELPPGALQSLVSVKVSEVSSLRPGVSLSLTGSKASGVATHWAERLETDLPADLTYEDGSAAMVTQRNCSYLGAWIDGDFLRQIFADYLKAEGVAMIELPDHIRLRKRGALTFAFNYGPMPWTVPFGGILFQIGNEVVGPHDFACWVDG